MTLLLRSIRVCWITPWVGGICESCTDGYAAPVQSTRQDRANSDEETSATFRQPQFVNSGGKSGVCSRARSGLPNRVWILRRPNQSTNTVASSSRLPASRASAGTCERNGSTLRCEARAEPRGRRLSPVSIELVAAVYEGRSHLGQRSALRRHMGVHLVLQRSAVACPLGQLRRPYARGVKCMFCQGESGTRPSKEHFLSIPVCRSFKLDRKAMIGRLDGKSGLVSSKARLEEIQVRLPCETCNSGWMNDLEEGMESLVAPWTRGRGPQLGREAERVLIRWSLKTHIVLAAIDGGTRAFGRLTSESKPSAVPEATRARKLYAGQDDAADGAAVGVAQVASSTYLWGFGNPTVIPIGPTFANARSASVTCLNLGKLQLWVVAPVFHAATVRLPPKVRRVNRRLEFARLSLAPSAEPDLGAAVVDNGHHDIDEVFAHASWLMSLP